MIVTIDGPHGMTSRFYPQQYGQVLHAKRVLPFTHAGWLASLKERTCVASSSSSRLKVAGSSP